MSPGGTGRRDARREETRRRFARGDTWFAASPLYQELCRMVLADERLLDLAARTRPGQQQANMLMAAVHLLLSKDPSAPLAAFYPSIVGAAARAPVGAGEPFREFCEEHREELAAILETRLVQTNVPGRGVALRLAMHEVARRQVGPVTFLEVGPSAGIQLRFDRWAVEAGGRRFGPDPAPLTLSSEWRSDTPILDLDVLPPISRRLGIDLAPVDVTDAEERRWLRALVWPEHRERMAQLDRALDVLAADPPEILAGDAVDLLPGLGEEVLGDGPLVVFHAMVRIHVPAARRTAFDRAIEKLGERRRLLVVSLEPSSRDRPSAREGSLLRIRDQAVGDLDLASVDGHGRWIRPLGRVTPS